MSKKGKIAVVKLMKNKKYQAQKRNTRRQG
jgi:hypothetical protein